MNPSGVSQPRIEDDERHDVRMDGVHFFRAAISGPFVCALDPGNYSYCVMVRAGRVRLHTDFPSNTEIEIGAGDAVAVSGLAPHSFGSIGARKRAPVGRFERRPLASKVPRAGVELIVGVAPSEALSIGSLMVGPIVVREKEQPDLARRLWSAVAMLEDEYADESWIDRNLVIRRLAEIMLVNMSRALLVHRGSTPDARSIPTSRQVMRAITAFFAAPERSWTLPDLAKAAGMSRTRFAETFKLVTGQTPKHVISRMRLTAIARRLASASLSVETAAEEAGYGSYEAFVRAFQREFGETPARWRRRRIGRMPAAEKATHSRLRAR